jgi:hypothetical protein
MKTMIVLVAALAGCFSGCATDAQLAADECAKGYTHFCDPNLTGKERSVELTKHLLNEHSNYGLGPLPGYGEQANHDAVRSLDDKLASETDSTLRTPSKMASVDATGGGQLNSNSHPVIARISDSKDSQSVKPKGFRFKDGFLISWGESKDRLMSQYPPFVDTKDGLRFESRSVDSTSQSAPGQIIKETIEKVYRITAGDGCDVMPQQLPNAYGYMAGPAFLWFNADRFYRIEVPFQTALFCDIERSLERALGTPKSRSIATVQNIFGASLENASVRWQAGEVSVVLHKLGQRSYKAEGDLETGSLTMQDDSLAKGAPVLPAPPAPF